MKKFLKILAGIIVFILFSISAVFYMTSDLADTADKFFTHVKSKDYDKAYTLLSEDFKAQTSINQLKSFLVKNRLTSFKEASWGNRSISSGRGTLTGSVTTENGGVVPITINFVKGESGWRIYAIQKPSSGITQEGTSTKMPSNEEQIQLVKQTMSVFAQTTEERSAKKLYKYISNLWRRQISVDSLDKSFYSFYGGNFHILRPLTPIFDKESIINSDDVLVIEGYYKIEPSPVIFKLKYIKEGFEWKLIGIDIKVE